MQVRLGIAPPFALEQAHKLSGTAGGLQGPLRTESVQVAELRHVGVPPEYRILMPMNWSDRSIMGDDLVRTLQALTEPGLQFAPRRVGRLMIELLPFIGCPDAIGPTSGWGDPDSAMQNAVFSLTGDAHRQNFALRGLEAHLGKPRIRLGRDPFAADESASGQL